MADSIDSGLDGLRRAVLKAVGRAGIELPVVNDVGQTQVVVALEEEPLNVLFARLKRAGGYANVFVRTSQSVVQVSVYKDECALMLDRSDQLTMPDDADSSVGMFLRHLEKSPDGVALNVRPSDPTYQGVAKELRDTSGVLV